MPARKQGIDSRTPARAMRRGFACMLLVLAATVATASARDPITPLSDVHRGLHCTARTVVQGTEISSFDVDVLDVVAGSGGTGARILVHVSGPAVAATGVAQGFSGSPVYCPDANGTIGNAGAISATIGQYGNDVALVTPIEEMLGIPVDPPSGVRRAPRLLRAARPVLSPLTISGLSPSLGRLVERSASRLGRTILAVPAGPLGTFAPQPLVPGASLAVALSSGDIAAGAIGTVTYRDGDTVYGFGHPLEGAGRRALLLQDAYVFTVVANPLDLGGDFPTSYKLAAPGHSLGTLSSDESAGVAGTVGALPATFPLTVRVHDLDRDQTARLKSDIADEVDVGTPDGPDALPLLASLAVAQGVATGFDGAPADQTGHMCLRAQLRESRKPLHFCNRYVTTGSVGEGEPPALAASMSDDVAGALGAIAKARFAALHLTSLSVSATVERGLRLATIRSVHGPRVVKPGHKARFALRVRLVRGPLRTLHVTTRIPRDTPPGPQTLRLSGTSIEGGDGDVGSLLADLLGGSGGGGGATGPAQTMRQVRDRFEGTARYDGITARIGKTHWHIYRDDDLRIDGHASFDVRVAGGKGSGAGPSDPALQRLLSKLLH